MAIFHEQRKPAGIIELVPSTKALDLPHRLPPKRKRILPSQLGLWFKRTLCRLGLLEVIHSIRAFNPQCPSLQANRTLERQLNPQWLLFMSNATQVELLDLFYRQGTLSPTSFSANEPDLAKTTELLQYCKGIIRWV